jgi:hypothetical protein
MNQQPTEKKPRLKYWRLNIVLPAIANRYDRNQSIGVVCYKVDEALEMARTAYPEYELESIHAYGTVDLVIQ